MSKKKSNTVKCRYKYCKHDTQEILREEAVLSGKSSYYHPDCFKEMKDKGQIVDLFLEHINKYTQIGQLRRVINNIVNDKGVDSGFLLFGLQYYIDHNIKLNYPGGLYYVISNKDVEAEYNKLKTQGIKFKFDLEEIDDDTFVYHQPKRKTIDNFMEV